MSLVTRGHGEGLIATWGFGKKLSGIIKQYLILKSYVIVTAKVEDLTVTSENKDYIYVIG